MSRHGSSTATRVPPRQCSNRLPLQKMVSIHNSNITKAFSHPTSSSNCQFAVPIAIVSGPQQAHRWHVVSLFSDRSSYLMAISQTMGARGAHRNCRRPTTGQQWHVVSFFCSNRSGCLTATSQTMGGRGLITSIARPNQIPIPKYQKRSGTPKEFPTSKPLSKTKLNSGRDNSMATE